MNNQTPEYYQNLSEFDEQSTAEEGKGSSSAATSSRRYQADAFQFVLPSVDWRDRSVYSLSGPTVDGIEHNITIQATDNIDSDSRVEFCRDGLDALVAELNGAKILLTDDVELASGQPARRGIVVWQPKGTRRYLEQIYVIHNQTGYTLSAVFSRSSRKQIGDAVERIMFSFCPDVNGPKS